MLCGAVVVLLYDTLGSIASQRFRFAYGRLAPGSYIIYAAVGFAAASVSHFWTGALSAAVVGVVDATAGWFISWQIGPGRPPEGTPVNEVTFLIMVPFLTALAVLAGGVGAGLAVAYRAWGG